MVREDRKAREGATSIEYGLIVALIAVVIITAISALGIRLRAPVPAGKASAVEANAQTPKPNCNYTGSAAPPSC